MRFVRLLKHWYKQGRIKWMQDPGQSRDREAPLMLTATA